MWAERCAGCGDCVLGYTGGICPVARCSKRIFNGPCGGSTKGKCEISPDVDCAWQLIWDRLKELGQTELYSKIMAPKDWRTARDGGPRRIVREDMAHMKSDSNLEKVLAAGHFAVTGELGPPRGANLQAAVKEKAAHLKGMVDAVNVTDNQTAVVRMASWAVSLVLKEMGMEPNYQMVCRDRNRLAMQSDILGAAALGINTMLCLSGDHPSFGDHPRPPTCTTSIPSSNCLQMVTAMRDEGKLPGGRRHRHPSQACSWARRPTPSATPLSFGCCAWARRSRPGLILFRHNVFTIWSVSRNICVRRSTWA